MKKRLGFRRRAHARTVAEHMQTITDLEDKDKIIDSLLKTADDLVGELRESLVRATASMRDSSGEAGDDGTQRGAAD
jgi:hypothetical protein